MPAASDINGLFLKSMPHEPTGGQKELIERLSAFLASAKTNRTFLLKGFAGTGKTTIVSALVRVLEHYSTSYLLMAPTGRAAKVLSLYSGSKAFTIHKAIYKTADDGGGGFSMMLKTNTYKNAVFVVDEASMIPGNQSAKPELFPASGLLDDLMSYVFSGENCSLIFVGDTAQLPPVGASLSPALDGAFLRSSYHLTLGSFELKEVVRQQEASGILCNATLLRNKLQQGGEDFVQFNTEGFSDFVRINGSELEDAINTSYSNCGESESVIICRSNKRANLYNNEIRRRMLFREGNINAGDKLMIVKNNYYWISKKSRAGFIANGDIAEVLRIRKFDTLGEEFFFADAIIRLIDYPEEPELEVKLLLNTLDAESPSLSYMDFRKLFHLVSAEYDEIKDKAQRMKRIFNDPYLNALQIKFSYAITCHKAQGGQWEHVFVEQGYLTREMLNTEYYRWLYTALTRASSKLFLVNFNDEFFEK